MENKDKILLDRIICQKANEFGFEMIKPAHSGTVVSIMREDWHLFIEMRSPVVPPLQLQMTVYVEDKTIGMTFFPSPIIIQSKNISQFIYLANVANYYLYLGTALGRFWVDEGQLDFAYEVRLKENMLEHCPEEVSRQLFAIPCSHFKDLHISLSMLAQDTWNADTAIRYLKELRENGHVDNSNYGLW